MIGLERFFKVLVAHRRDYKPASSETPFRISGPRRGSLDVVDNHRNRLALNYPMHLYPQMSEEERRQMLA